MCGAIATKLRVAALLSLTVLARLPNNGHRHPRSRALRRLPNAPPRRRRRLACQGLAHPRLHSSCGGRGYWRHMPIVASILGLACSNDPPTPTGLDRPVDVRKFIVGDAAVRLDGNGFFVMARRTGPISNVRSADRSTFQRSRSARGRSSRRVRSSRIYPQACTRRLRSVMDRTISFR
jgi:hypothetical protein